MTTSTLPRILALAVGGVLLAGCSAPASAPAPATSNASSTDAPATSTSQPASTTSAPPASTMTLPPITKYGRNTKECVAASESLLWVTRIGNKANSGKVEASDVDKAFRGLDDLPPGLKEIAAGLKVTSEKLVGLSAEAASPFVGEFAQGLDLLVKGTEIVCS